MLRTRQALDEETLHSKICFTYKVLPVTFYSIKLQLLFSIRHTLDEANYFENKSISNTSVVIRQVHNEEKHFVVDMLSTIR